MENSSAPRQPKRLNVPGIVVIILGLVLFALLLFLEYTHGTKRGDITGSIIYTLPFPLLLTASVLAFAYGITQEHQTHMPWHRHQGILLGLVYLSLLPESFVLLVNSLMNNGLPDVVGIPIVIVGALLEVLVVVRLIMVRLSKTERLV